MANGVIGELYIGGDCLALGYHKRPDLTDKAFIDINEFPQWIQQTSLSCKLYKTGDLVKRHLNGDIEYLGRIDHQVKVRGCRIELGEIETKLNAIDLVKESVVVAAKINDSFEVCAAIALADGRSADQEAVIASRLSHILFDQLPVYMIPKYYQVMKTLPTTQNNKFDRKRVIALFADMVADNPKHKAENLNQPDYLMLRNIWAGVLKLAPEEIAVSDSFFLLGGNSMLILAVQHEIQRKFSKNLTLKQLFFNPVFQDMAALISAESQSALAVKPLAKNANIELSAMQQYAWDARVVKNFSSTNDFYHSCIRLEGDIDTGWLKDALRKIVKRHQAFSFTYTDAGKGQLNASIPLSIIEINTPAQEAFSKIAAQVEKPFDLVNGPLYRFILTTVDNNDHYLGLVFHKAIADAWSFRIVLHELSLIFQAKIAATAIKLPDIAFGYFDYLSWQQKTFEQASYKKQLDFWRQHLQGYVPKKLPVDHAAYCQAPNTNRHFYDQTFDRAVVDHFCHATQQGEFSAYFGLFALLYYQQTKQHDFVVGVPCGNRNQIETKNMVAALLNWLPVRIQVQPGDSVRTFLAAAAAAFEACYQHSSVPYPQLCQQLGYASHGPEALMKAVFTFRGKNIFMIDFPGVKVTRVYPTNADNNSSFMMTVDEKPSQMSLQYAYFNTLFKEQTIYEWAKEFYRMIVSVTEYLDMPVNRYVNLLMEEEIYAD